MARFENALQSLEENRLKQLFKTFYWTKKKLKKYREIIKFIKREQVYIFAYLL